VLAAKNDNRREVKNLYFAIGVKHGDLIGSFCFWISNCLCCIIIVITIIEAEGRDFRHMKIFMDTANTNEIAELADWGIVYGVTTNPSLIAKTGRQQEQVIAEICRLIEGPVSAEVISTDCPGMLIEARSLASIAPNVVVKLPCTVEGLKAVRLLKKENVRTNVTLVFSLTQALLAVEAGASYVSPFIGRLDDIGEDGMKIVEDMVTIFRNYGYKAQIIAASIRDLNHVHRAMLAGVDIATIPTKIIREMIGHKLTDAGLKKFLEDYEESLSKANAGHKI